jgi:hypothetical protein
MSNIKVERLHVVSLLQIQNSITVLTAITLKLQIESLWIEVCVNKSHLDLHSLDGIVDLYFNALLAIAMAVVCNIVIHMHDYEHYLRK